MHYNPYQPVPKNQSNTGCAVVLWIMLILFIIFLVIFGVFIAFLGGLAFFMNEVTETEPPNPEHPRVKYEEDVAFYDEVMNALPASSLPAVDTTSCAVNAKSMRCDRQDYLATSGDNIEFLWGKNITETSEFRHVYAELSGFGDLPTEEGKNGTRYLASTNGDKRVKLDAWTPEVVHVYRYDTQTDLFFEALLFSSTDEAEQWLRQNGLL